MAVLAGRGLMNCTPRLYEVPLAWQLICGSAVSSPRVSLGIDVAVAQLSNTCGFESAALRIS